MLIQIEKKWINAGAVTLIVPNGGNVRIHLGEKYVDIVTELTCDEIAWKINEALEEDRPVPMRSTEPSIPRSEQWNGPRLKNPGFG